MRYPAAMLPKVKSADFLASATNVAQLPPPMFAEIAFAGRSNVGKSSLINSLLNRRKLVRTSSTPGCTRGLNLFRVEMDLGVLDLVDLPGYGYAKRSKVERRSWGPMIENFLTGRAGLRGIVLIIDIRRGMTEDDAELLAFARHIGKEVLLVTTKIDKLPRGKQKPAVQALARTLDTQPLPYSSQTNAGREPLWNAVLKLAGIGQDGTGDGAPDAG